VKIEETIILKYTHFDSANFEMIQKFLLMCPSMISLTLRNLNISVTVRFDFDIQF